MVRDTDLITSGFYIQRAAGGTGSCPLNNLFQHSALVGFPLSESESSRQVSYGLAGRKQRSLKTLLASDPPLFPSGRRNLRAVSSPRAPPQHQRRS